MKLLRLSIEVVSLVFLIGSCAVYVAACVVVLRFAFALWRVK